MLIKIIAVLAVLIETLLCLFTDIVSGWTDFLIPIVLFLGLTVGIFVVYLLVLAVISLFVSQNKPCDKPHKFFISNINLVAELVLWFLRVKVNFNNIEKIPTDRKFLLVSNHRSMIDAFVLVDMLNNFSVSFISKPENFKLPLIGVFMHKSGFLAIDRENARNAMKTIHKATDFVKNDVASVVVYPEGTRSKTGELLEFKDGVFYICKKAKCPVVVTTTNNAEKVMKRFPFKSTVINVDVLAVLEPETFEDKTTHQISDEVRNMMLNNLGK